MNPYQDPQSHRLMMMNRNQNQYSQLPQQRMLIPAQSYEPGQYVLTPMARGLSNDSRRSNASIAAERRPGHFVDLSTFARCERDGVNLEGIDSEPAMNAWLEPGSIIRVHDDRSRLHSRVMLVIRTHRSGSSMSKTCLSFCKHENLPCISPGFIRELAFVADARSQERPGNVPVEMVCLKVFIGKDHLIFELEPDVWINIREIWNIDIGVWVAKLGQAEPESFQALSQKVKEVFCATLGDADMGTPRPRASQSPRHTYAQVASRPSAREERPKRRSSIAEKIAGRGPLF